MSGVEFEPWPKIARLNRDVTVTEKIDGTNAAVLIVTVSSLTIDGVFTVTEDVQTNVLAVLPNGPDDSFLVFAQSRTRFITPGKGTDNYGFAAYVRDNAEALVATLGEGRHFGEWWGSGIQRGYGLTGGERRFSLFNVGRWEDEDLSSVPGLNVVPTLYVGSLDGVEGVVGLLRILGSEAAHGYSNPEGVVVFHTGSRQSFKVTLEGDESPKGAAAHALDEERAA